MSSKSKRNTPLQVFGLSLFGIGLVVFTLALGLDQYTLGADAFNTIDNEYHRDALLAAAREAGQLDQEYATSFAAVGAFNATFSAAQEQLAQRAAEGIPEGVGEWDFKLGDWKKGDYQLAVVKAAETGPVASNPLLFWLLSVGLAIVGGLIFFIPKFQTIPGIKNDHVFHSSLKRGLNLGWRSFFLGAGIIGILLYGVYYLGQQYFWPAVSAVVALIIIGLVFFAERSIYRRPARSAGPEMSSAWLGILAGIYLVGFYVLLYWTPQYITPWISMVDPLSYGLNGGPASRWFLYGSLYTIVILVMGVRMFARYRHNRYQLIRTGSVMFFQLAFAFLIPELLLRFNQPTMDLKNIWPLNYSFFFGYNLDALSNSGALGMFMLVWGIALVLLAVPLLSYFFGKRWYCSWVCGCGGLAETLGDPFRQNSDKSLRAWQFERWIIHGVLVFAVVMTALVLYTYFTGEYRVLGIQTGDIQSWYGFLIGAGFAGVVGTGFYPLMGNRVWCRFGCPLAAYLGLVQRFKSRFRITVNGGQCISCGNCSVYCEMGIDVRHYAQRGQDVVRSSCVGCGICAAVCPRGVLRLENASGDSSRRTDQLRTVHVKESEVGLLLPEKEPVA